jgi:aminoethylphosphonate catabolism LysR family transcriptional regulator
MLNTQLRSFHAVAREGSVTKAARILNVSQPTLTTQIKQLEVRYKLELFRRIGKRLELTDLGHQLLLVTQRYFEVEAEVSGFLETAQGTVRGHLRIAAIGPFPIMKFLYRFYEAYPDVTVSIELGNSDSVLSSLREQRADIGIVSRTKASSDLAGTRFGKQNVVVFVPSSHPWSQRECIRLAELGGQNMIMREDGSSTRRVTEKALNEQNVKPNVVMEVGSREAVWEAVAEGLGVGVVSEISIRPDPRIKVLVISDSAIETDIEALCLKQSLHTATVRAFFELVTSTEVESLGFSELADQC